VGALLRNVGGGKQFEYVVALWMSVHVLANNVDSSKQRPELGEGLVGRKLCVGLPCHPQISPRRESPILPRELDHPERQRLLGMSFWRSIRAKPGILNGFTPVPPIFPSP
jgi:hypothetical protein